MHLLNEKYEAKNSHLQAQFSQFIYVTFPNQLSNTLQKQLCNFTAGMSSSRQSLLLNVQTNPFA